MRGGKRKGAGRPKGSTKGIIRKIHTFRLSEMELIEVKNLLNKLRGK